ncbi:MAG: hypothetical protein ACI4GB_04345, partial [Acutalibacteraceae bacterium]
PAFAGLFRQAAALSAQRHHNGQVRLLYKSICPFHRETPGEGFPRNERKCSAFFLVPPFLRLMKYYFFSRQRSCLF